MEGCMQSWRHQGTPACSCGGAEPALYVVCDVTSPLPELLAALAQVPVVVTVEGSQWVHGHFGAALGALIVVINPADRFNALIADMVPALGQRMATIVADKAEDGYHVDVQRLLALIDRAQDDMARTGESLQRG